MPLRERLHRHRWGRMRCLRCRELQGREWIGGVYAVPGRDIQHCLGSDVCVDVHSLFVIILFSLGDELFFYFLFTYHQLRLGFACLRCPCSHPLLPPIFLV